MKKHILLIEDERDGLSVFVKALNETQLSYKCTYAKDCTHALQMLDYLEPDYIFVDQHTVGLNSIDGLKPIREKQRLRSVPIVLFLSSMTNDIAERASAIGVDYCYTKPSSIDELSTLLTDIILTGAENREVKNTGVNTPG